MRYAYVLDQNNYRDLVHNAYVYYYKKSEGGNLFEQAEPYILRCVKFMWRWNTSNLTFNKEFVEYVDEEHFTEVNPLGILESKDIVEIIHEKIRAYHSGGLSSVDSVSLLKVMDLVQRGYTGNEIGTMMDISFQTASNYKKKIRSLIESVPA